MGRPPAEAEGALPGDELVPRADLGYTRAVTVEAPVAEVWPWLAQIGQGRGGLYSYDGLENLLGCRIHSADHVLPEHQSLRRGDLIRLGPDGYPAFRVHEVDPPTTLVLLSAGPEAAHRTARPTPATPSRRGSGRYGRSTAAAVPGSSYGSDSAARRPSG